MEILVLFLLVSTLTASAAQEAFVGVNIGTKVSSSEAAALLKSHEIKHVRLYDADADMLLALANTSITVAVSVPNDQILGISLSNSTAAKWVSQNVVTHYPHTNITTICIGVDAPALLPNALKHMYTALSAANLEKQIKISAPLPYTIIQNSVPPSQAYFNKSLDPMLVPLLKFLQSTNSHFMITIYPYLEHVRSSDLFPLDYALFEPSKQTVDANTSLRYSNAFDAMVDAAYSAMAKLNITNVPIVVAETGWPSQGGTDATSDNARTYNTNLVKHVMNKSGTPRHPGIAVSAYIYELYNEDSKTDPISEKNWGLFEANGTSVYTIQFGAANESTNQTYCAAKAGADPKMVQAALDWACGAGKVDCSALMAGQPCFEPDTLSAHATYAFDSYYQQMGRVAGSCDFNGVATVTSTTPSHGSCIISQAESDKNGSRLNSTVPAMDSESSYTSSSLAYGYGYGDAFSATRFMIGLIGCVVLF
ncbi:glucan endo-1,3-beta-glucosidase 3-like [Salvia miltiorrhiza]|uniref:glucan endo-1,3-beta-glucosidase 3-like n=1 Tax=Salvia miltiorrhiza TaxID=226208 RepID=UPI0025ABB65B|nr:glucan endo-1,3-beta-glucosidase 3-like [Salvia miltiorrhiza]